ncbi:DNA repair protein RecO [Gemella sp. GH3]|uniref:DNA repair protein RecO n=1 Tax=unclassified Gemella TaxID=2624949 RepID=UPI0015CFEFF5|nr:MULTISPECIES: DNA repair protein RecO [unclassified Gemella]MBF0713182.1 DNA repair protein RecO [Gemella sp. GH3.1]NYS50134.1 DNA repair protein RecO [Gemella sp. GH3]
MIRKGITKGIVLKKIPYRDYHEIVHILTESGEIESFFYENVNKNKKLQKLSIPCTVTAQYFYTSGMNKIITIDIDDYFSNIIYDVMLSSYIGNILEIISYLNHIPHKYYKLLVELINLVNDSKIDVKLANIYFIINILKLEGFNFKYKKDVDEYACYSFKLNMFIDFVDSSSSYMIDNKLTKLIYILSNYDVDILEKVFLENDETIQLLNFINLLIREYLGLETKSYKKILELEEMFNSFKEDNRRYE